MRGESKATQERGDASAGTSIVDAIGAPLALGLIVAYALLHLCQLWPALASRQAFVLHAIDDDLRPALGIACLVLVALYASLGLRGAWLQTKLPRDARDPRSGFVAFTGVLSVLFVGLHAWQVGGFGPHDAAQAAASALAYDHMWQLLGAPGWFVAYVVGVSALAFHVAVVGLRALAQRRSPEVSAARGFQLGNVLVCVLAALLWLACLQVVARFAIGEGIVPTAAPIADPTTAAPH